MPFMMYVHGTIRWYIAIFITILILLFISFSLGKTWKEQYNGTR